MNEDFEDYEVCEICDNEFERGELPECENCGKLMCEDCTALFIGDVLCKSCAEEDTGFTEEEREIIEDSWYDEEVFKAAKELGIEFDNVEDAYEGEYTSDEEFVRQLLEDIGDIASNLPISVHIDWKTTAQDVMYDYGEHNGHYFRYL